MDRMSPAQVIFSESVTVSSSQRSWYNAVMISKAESPVVSTIFRSGPNSARRSTGGQHRYDVFVGQSFRFYQIEFGEAPCLLSLPGVGSGSLFCLSGSPSVAETPMKPVERERPIRETERTTRRSALRIPVPTSDTTVDSRPTAVAVSSNAAIVPGTKTVEPMDPIAAVRAPATRRAAKKRAPNAVRSAMVVARSSIAGRAPRGPVETLLPTSAGTTPVNRRRVKRRARSAAKSPMDAAGHLPAVVANLR